MHGGEYAIRRKRNIRRTTFLGFLGILAAVVTMLLVLAVVAVALAAKPASAAPISGGADFTEIGSSSETPLAPILADTGYSLVRIADSIGQLWEIADVPQSAVVRARHAGYANTFGVMAFDGPDADLFQPLFTPRGPSQWDSASEPWFDLGHLFEIGEQFMLALKTLFNAFTSVASRNADGLDHMVTWVDAFDSTHYFVGFEDLLNGGDRDFNDVVFELQFVLDGPIAASVPEPSPLLPLAAGVAVLGLALRRRRDDS